MRIKIQDMAGARSIHCRLQECSKSQELLNPQPSVFISIVLLVCCTTNTFPQERDASDQRAFQHESGRGQRHFIQRNHPADTSWAPQTGSPTFFQHPYGLPRSFNRRRSADRALYSNPQPKASLRNKRQPRTSTPRIGTEWQHERHSQSSPLPNRRNRATGDQSRGLAWPTPREREELKNHIIWTLVDSLMQSAREK